MVLLDLADASWFPLLLVILVGAAMVLLFFSMRHEIGKIRLPGDNAQLRAEAHPQSPDDAGER